MITENNESTLDSDKCPRCLINKSENDHACPYHEEINDDFEYRCNCCDDCRHDCAMSI